MVDQVVVRCFGIGRSRKVDSICLAGLLDVVISSSQADERRVEVTAISLDGLHAISSGVTGNEDR